MGDDQSEDHSLDEQVVSSLQNPLFQATPREPDKEEFSYATLYGSAEFFMGSRLLTTLSMVTRDELGAIHPARPE